MSKEKMRQTPISERALEMVMHDVLDCLFEVSLESAYSEHGDDFEIIDITPGELRPRQPQTVVARSEESEVIPFPQQRRATA